MSFLVLNQLKNVNSTLVIVHQPCIYLKETCNNCTLVRIDFPGGSDGKASAYNAGDLGSIPGLGRSPGEGNGNPLQYSCLENPMDEEAW